MSTSPAATPKHRELGLTDFEYDRIVDLMGRTPGDVELAMFSLLWSEHCAYKHSKKLLRKLPTESPRMLMGPGENAGAVSVGENGDWAVAFKVESHNHPSAVEPFQGAATGVGGILRDVFALGARPIALLDSLRFGELDSPRTRFLFEHVVGGIGHYGNSIGVPTVGGEVAFEDAYESNCLVNAMCIGLAPTPRLMRAAAAGVGNAVVLMGASTGRDGIGGASVLASADLELDADKRPTVQIGDPFEESKLVECCLELLDRELLVSLQDLGAAGLTSAAGEMASAGGVGLDLDVAAVPLREADMEPFEIMVSESQERMLAVVEPDKVADVIEVCERWLLNSARIGTVTDTGQILIHRGDELVGDIPVDALVDGCPLYDLRPAEPVGWIYGNRRTLDEGAEGADILTALISAPTIASKRWAYEQYDTIVGSRTVRRAGSADAAVLLIPEADTAIATAIDGNGRRVACDPRAGTIEAVLECAQNLACVGGEPFGLTNCLNFGNPEKPTVAWQLDTSVQALADVCNQLGIPVVGGNVSLYNETGSGPIYPTPVIGLVGETGDPALLPSGPAEGDVLVLAGPFTPSLAGSELAKQRGELDAGLPLPDIAATAAAIGFVRDEVRAGALRGATDVSDGGLAVKLAEIAIAAGAGINADAGALADRVADGSGEAALFGEGTGGFVLAVAAGGEEDLIARATDAGVATMALGSLTGTGDDAVLELAAGEVSFTASVDKLAYAWNTVERQMAH